MALAILPQELLLQICSRCDTKSLLSLATISKTIGAAAETLIYREVVIYLYKRKEDYQHEDHNRHSSHASVLEAMNTRPSLLANIRTLQIENRYNSHHLPSDLRPIGETLWRTLPRMTGLQRISFELNWIDYQKILSFMPYLGKIDMRVKIHGCQLEVDEQASKDHFHPSKLNLVPGSGILRSLHINLHINDEDDESDDRYEQLKCVLFILHHSRGLKTLAIETADDPADDPADFGNFKGPNECERRLNPPLKLESLCCRGVFPFVDTGAFSWSNSIKWDMLQKLYLSAWSTDPCLPQTPFSHLTHLNIAFVYNDQSIDLGLSKFLRVCPNLKYLKLGGLGHFFDPDGLSNVSRDFETLILFSYIYQDQFISPNDYIDVFDKKASGLPFLKNLGINVELTSEEEVFEDAILRYVLKISGILPNLENLYVRVDLPHLDGRFPEEGTPGSDLMKGKKEQLAVFWQELNHSRIKHNYRALDTVAIHPYLGSTAGVATKLYDPENLQNKKLSFKEAQRILDGTSDTFPPFM